MTNEEKLQEVELALDGHKCICGWLGDDRSTDHHGRGKIVRFYSAPWRNDIQYPCNNHLNCYLQNGWVLDES